MIRSDFQKKIKVIDYHITKKGLYLVYEIDGKEFHLDAGPEEAAELLQEIGLIEITSVGQLRWEVISDSSNYRGEHVQKNGLCIVGWEDFVSEFTFSQSDAIDVAVQHEYNKWYNKGVQAFKMIPNMLKSLLSPTV